MSDLSGFLPEDEHFDTKAIHSSYNPADNQTLGVIPPIILSTTFHQPDLMKQQHFRYSRFGNPNREMLEITVASLENGKYANCFSSGMGAISMVSHLLRDRDHVLCMDDVYGGTQKYFHEVGVIHGTSVTYADLTEVDNVDKHIKPNTKMVWIESPTNPLMKVVDIVAVSKRAKRLNPNVWIIVDNSFLSPFFQRPLELGADVVVSSLTKYINGHSDVMMGVTVTNNKKLHDIFTKLQAVCGATPSSFDCFLVLRGIRTLRLRMRAHMYGAYKVAKYLETHPMVEKVLYPGLPTHPGHEIAKQQWHGVGGMLSFYIKGGIRESTHFLKSLKLFSTGASYGGFESLTALPALMSHNWMSKEELIKKGILDNLIRLSIGLESIDDLIADIGSAFDSVSKM